MKRFLSLVFVTLLLLYPLHAARALTNTNAVTFGVSTSTIATPMSTKNINGVTGSSPTFFMSFWYNLNQRPYAGEQLFVGRDLNGTQTIQVSFVGDATSPYLEVDAIDENGFCAHVSTGLPGDANALTMPFDGQWHSVQIQLFSIALTGGNFLRAQLALDGVVHEMEDSTLYQFDQFPWTAVSDWEVGASYTGGLAELYVDLYGRFVQTTLSSLALNAFRSFTSGKAPGLGVNCTGPTGIEPNMCNRGAPCNFWFGPFINSNFAYVLRPSILNGAFQLKSTSTEPCQFTNDGSGADGYSPGTGCPVTQQPPNP